MRVFRRSLTTIPAAGVRVRGSARAKLALGPTLLVLMLASAAPTLAAVPPVWTVTHVQSASALTAISCPAPSLCVAVDNGGNVISSTSPASGQWTRRHLEKPIVYPRGGGQDAFVDVSCASPHLCVAIDWFGAIWTSSNPANGHWKRRVLVRSPFAPGTNASLLESLACLRGPFCVATSVSGNVLTSTDPLHGRWQKHHIKHDLRGLSCASRKLCVAYDAGGNGFVSQNPTGGPGAWKRAPSLKTFTGGDVSCPPARLTFCAVFAENVSSQTFLYLSNNPSSGSFRKLAFPLPTATGIDASSCTSRTFCVAFGQTVDPNLGARTFALTSTNPAQLPWSGVFVDSGTVRAVSCTSRRFCAAVDDTGNAVVSTNPLGG